MKSKTTFILKFSIVSILLLFVHLSYAQYETIEEDRKSRFEKLNKKLNKAKPKKRVTNEGRKKVTPPPAFEVDTSTTLFKVAEEMPLFPGCEELVEADFWARKKCADEEMLKFIYQNLTYPLVARENGIEGQVVVQFVINKNGYVEDINLARDIGGGCGDAAVATINLMNEQDKRWSPGRIRGKPVKVLYTLPVKFKLTGGEIENINTLGVSQNNKGEEMPRFPGCEHIKDDPLERQNCADQKLMKYIHDNLELPRKARRKKVEGRIIVQFTIEEDGYIGDMLIVQDIGYGSGDALLDVIESTNFLKERWIPGKQNGENVKVVYAFPFDILSETKRKKSSEKRIDKLIWTNFT